MLFNSFQVQGQVLIYVHVISMLSAFTCHFNHVHVILPGKQYFFLVKTRYVSLKENDVD